MQNNPKPPTIVRIKGDYYRAAYVLKNTVVRSFERTPEGDYVLDLDATAQHARSAWIADAEDHAKQASAAPAGGATVDRHPRSGNYETFHRLGKGLPASAVMIEDLDPEEVQPAPDTLRMTVVLEDRSGATLLLSPDDVPKVLEAVEQSLRPLQIDLARTPDQSRVEDLIVAKINSRESRIATMLALYWAWHELGPEGIEAVLEKHKRACITVAADRRLEATALLASAEYREPFDSAGALLLFQTA